MTNFSELVTSIVADLQQGGFSKDAADLQDLANLAVDQTVSPAARTEALLQISLRCNVKWLGDIYLSNLSQKDWWGKLEKLGKISKKIGKTI